MGTVALVFAPLAPLVVVAAAVVFWISSWVYKYQLMFVFVTRVETGGVSAQCLCLYHLIDLVVVKRLWNVVVNRLLASVILMQMLMVLSKYPLRHLIHDFLLLIESAAIGLQKGWTSFYWVSTIPPILFILAFKVYLSRTFNPAFRSYIPSQQELQAAQVHSKRADSSGNRLEKRFGHPALHQELFTPMVHANMTALLPDVYKGKIGNASAHVDGNRVEAAVVAGIKIAAVDQVSVPFHT